MPRTTKEILATLDLTGNKWLRERVLAALDEAYAAGATDAEATYVGPCRGIVFIEGGKCPIWEKNPRGCAQCERWTG